MNETELAWLEYTREEVIGRMHVTDIISPDSRIVFTRTFPVLKEKGYASDI